MAQDLGFEFKKPARPDVPTPPKHLRHFTGERYLWQAKIDGSAKVVHCRGEKGWTVWTRHGEWRATCQGNDFFTSGPQNKELIEACIQLHHFADTGIFACEFTDKAKRATKDGKIVRGMLIVWDVIWCPFSSLRLSGYRDRMEWLTSQIEPTTSTALPFTQAIDGYPRIAVIRSYSSTDSAKVFEYYKEPETLYRDVVAYDLLYEGLVIRDPEAGAKDSRGMFKVRRAKTGIYAF